MKKSIILTVLIGALFLPGPGRDFDPAKLDLYFDALESGNKFMGSVALARDGELIYLRSIGSADVEQGLKADEHSRYRIGSISKTFTAVMVLKAVETGKLALDQAIREFFPTVPRAEKITVAQLLTHRSGIHNFTDDAGYLSWYTQAKNEQEMVEIIAAAGSDFEPDSKAQYSNSNYVLLSYMLEKVFKKSYSEILSEIIAKPLGLKNTYLGARIDPAQNEARSYRFSGEWLVEPETDMSIPMGAGGIVSTPGDLVRFSDALFGGKLLRPGSLQFMKTVKDRYGAGLFQLPLQGKIGYGHTGGIDGFASVFCHFEEGGISYAQVSNGSNYNNNDVSLAVLSAAYDLPYELPSFERYELKPEDLEQYLGVYASEQLPLKITLSRDGATLVAQAAGQSAIPLEATGKDRFSFDPAGLVMEFDPKAGSFVLKQGGGRFIFKKE